MDGLPHISPKKNGDNTSKCDSRFGVLFNKHIQMPQISSDWNRHGPVGACLLANWVEERAVGNQVLEERNIRSLSHLGHQGILTHSTSEHPLDRKRSLCNETYVSHIPHKEAVQKRKGFGVKYRLLETDLFQKALDEYKVHREKPSTQDWVSVTHKNYGQGRKCPDLPPPSKDAIHRHNDPITFWSTHTGTTTVYRSTPFNMDNIAHASNPNQLTSNPKPVRQSRFPRIAQFSTPIQYYMGGPTKDL